MPLKKAYFSVLLFVVLNLCNHAFAATTESITITGAEKINSSNGLWDAGALTITITINGSNYVRTAQYGQFSTPDSLASALAASIASDCYSPVNAKSAPGGIIYFKAKNAANISQITINNNGSISFSSGSQDLSIIPTTTVATIGSTQLLSGHSTTVSVQVSCANCGNADYRLDGGEWPTVGLNASGQASLTTSTSLSIGLHNVIVQYQGNGSYMASTSNPVSFTIASSPTRNTIYSYNISPYKANGNIAAYSDTVNGNWSNITYDGLNRLSTATESIDGITQYMCWSYDPFGNRTAQMTSGAPCSSPPQTVFYPVNNQIPGLQYDPGGDVMGGDGNQYRYDAEGRVCTVQYTIAGISVTVGYLYDAEGRRVAKGTINSLNCDPTAPFSETNGYMLGPNGEQIAEVNAQGNWLHTNLFANGQLVATYDPTGVHFHVSDWLGSRRVQIDPNYVADTYTYSYFQNLPFGEMPENQNYNLGVTEQHFTGKERDTESGNDYFGARYYASSMGRFMSPDPSGLLAQNPADPQSWNLYAYARNNPLINIDPTGLDCVYYNDSGNKVEEVDHNSDPDFCKGDGGNWEEGHTEAGWQKYDRKIGTWTGFSADSNNVYMYGGVAGGGNGTGDGSNYMPACQGNCMNGTSASISSLNNQLQNGATLLGLMQFAITQTNWVGNAAHDLINFNAGASVNNWCGAGGAGVPGSSTDWACLVHDFNYNVAGFSVSSNFNPTIFLQPTKVQQLQKINQALCDNVSGMGGAEVSAYFHTVGSITAPCQ